MNWHAALDAVVLVVGGLVGAVGTLAIVWWAWCHRVNTAPTHGSMVRP